MTTTLKKYTILGQEVGQVEVSEQLSKAYAPSQLVKDYIVALRENARQWSANTKGRSEVEHTTRKPHPQKGQGRARQGSTVAPQYKGGGRVFGPKPKFGVHVKINQKSKRSVIRAVFAEKIRDGKVHVLDTTTIEMPKTKIIQQFLDGIGIERRVLFIAEGAHLEIGFPAKVQRMSISTDKHDAFKLSMRNIPQVNFALVGNVNGYNVMLAHDIVITEDALKELEAWLA
jgi:large subunit ribosomal protein L4